MNVFIIHGVGGLSEANWFPWLKRELESLGCDVYVPNFPQPSNQSLETWMKQFEQYFDKIDSDTIFVGHSLGPSFILSILEKIDMPVKAVFLVAGFVGKLGISEFDEINYTFTEKSFSWEKIKQNCRKFYVINSDNDPYVPLEKGEVLAEKLDGELIIVEGAGHINESSGHFQFLLLLEKIKEEI